MFENNLKDLVRSIQYEKACNQNVLTRAIPIFEIYAHPYF